MWLHVLSDLLIGLSYVAISATLVVLVRRGRESIAFHGMFLAFGLFIIACGATHLMEVWTLWNPHYWLSGGVKAVTAIASVATAFALPPLVPVALGVVRNARVSDQRRVDLEAAHSELNQVYEKLKEFDELKTQFFANVSHELRTPLTLILGRTERMMGDPALSEEHRRHLEVAHRNAVQLLRHVNELLDLSKLDAGRMTPQYAEVDLSRLVRLTLSNFETAAHDSGIELAADVPESLPAQVDPEKIQHVLSNLLSNALKFTPSGGSVRCVLEFRLPGPGETTGPQAVLLVRDSGPGVPPALRKTIFERFRQLEGGATRRFGGTGLGLSIVKDFVELHGGSISVGEAPEGGAEFHITLPLGAPPGAAVAADWLAQGAAPDQRPVVPSNSFAAGSTTGAESSGATAGSSEDLPRVLVVEDNPEMRAYIEETLAPEYSVATAPDGQEGLARAVADPPDLIVTDMMMPRMSGDQLVYALRGRPELDAVPVLLLTARVDEALRVSMLEAGAQDYLTKPFATPELRARVGNLVRTKRAREVLQTELVSREADLESLARDVAVRNRELRTALDETRIARDAAERASEVKTSFLRMVSHELRTPLTSLQLQVQLLMRNREGNLLERQQESLSKAHAASVRLQELIESLLEYARIQSGKLTTRVEPVPLTDLAQDVIEEMGSQAAQKGLELVLAPGADSGVLRSDRQLVRLVLVNLVGNAIKFTQKGRVEIAISRMAEDCRLEVRDTGPGIEPAQQVVIFEPFAQLEAIRYKHTPGVGLGLAIVREIVTALGGRIAVRSRPGEGSTFIVTLRDAPEPEPAATTADGEEAAPEPPGGLIH